MLDEWSIKEKLALASSVVRSGDNNWMMVSRLVRPFANPSRPIDWFTQTNCARQYSELLKLVEGPRRKRGDGEGESNPGEIIVRKLTSERIEELKTIIAEHAEKYRSIREELEDIKAGKYDGQMKEKWMNLQTKKREDAELIAQKLKAENDAHEKARQATLKSHQLARNKLNESQAIKKNPTVDIDSNICLDILNSNDILNFEDNLDNKVLQINQSAKSDKSSNNDMTTQESTNSKSVTMVTMVDEIQADDPNVNEFSTPLITNNTPDKNQLNENKISPLKILTSDLNLSHSKILVSKSPTSIRSCEDKISPRKNLSPKYSDAMTTDVNPLKSSGNPIVPLKLSPIKISRDLLSPIGSGGAFKIFQKELPDVAFASQKDIKENLDVDMVTSNEDLNSNMNLNDSNETCPPIETNDGCYGNNSTPRTINKEDTSSNDNKATNSTSENEVIKPLSENSATEDNKTELSEDELKNKSEYSTSNINDKSSFFEYESGNVNMKLKFDVSDSLPGSPASISNSDTEDERSHKIWKKSIMLVWRAIANHKFANVFLHPVTEDIAPGYHSIVLRPMDLITIRKNIDIGLIRTTSEFQRDVMLMFVNAIMYNNSNQYVHQMARTMFHDAMAQIEQFVSTQMMVQTEPKLLRTLRRSEVAVLLDKGEDDGRKRKTIESEVSSAKKKKVPTATLR